MNLRYLVLYLFLHLLLANCTLLQRSVKIAPVTFDYKSISDNYFSPNQSKPFPLTVQRGNNLFNSTTADGRYLFYATDQKGNYDIWFRDLQSSVVVPVTNSPFSESKPAISPDGRYLVYVSEEYDSNGDIILLDMDIEEWKSELLNGNRYINQDTKNLTNPNHKETDLKQQVVDTDPIWSPDGKVLLFVTDRFTPGLPNLAVMDPAKPERVIQLTSDGAVNPTFSKKGDLIYFVSYKEDRKGEVYELKLADKSISRITNNNYLDYSPTVDSKNKFLFYSSIRKDTNQNGYLDERDTNYLVMLNLQTGKERILSSGEASYFDVRYSNFNGGSILFSAPYFNSINIYFIPESGSVPRQNSISDQYQYTKIFQEKQSLDSYFLGLDSLELFYSEDELYPIYSAKVKALKASALEKLGRKKEANQIYQDMTAKTVSSLTAYEIGLGRWLGGASVDRNEELRRFILTLEPGSVSKDTIPSLMQIVIDEYEKLSKPLQAVSLLKELNEKYPTYHQIREIRRRIGGYEFTRESKNLPSVYKDIISNWQSEKNRYLTNLASGFSNDSKRDLRYVLEDIANKIETARSSEEIIQWVDLLLQSPENQSENTLAIYLNYAKAKALSNLRMFSESNAILDSLIPIPVNIDLEPPGKPSVFEMASFQAAYKNPILLRANLLKYQNQKALGNTSDALRNMKIYLEFYDPILGVDLNVDEIQNAFFYFENKALEFERMGNLLQSSFHYFFNNQNMFLVKTRNLYLDTLYKDYAVYYQRKMVDTIFDYGKKLREEEEKALINQLNILGKDKLNVIGNITDVTSIVTDNKYLRSVVDLKDLEKIEVLSGEALRWTELYYKQAVPRARPHLDLATLYGYAYFLINKYVIYETYYYATNTMTDARKKEILENYKKAEWELKWIIFAEPTYYDAYQLLGWLYQYIDLIKLRKTDVNSETDEEMYLSLYKRFFPEKNLEANVELYTQILVFLGDKNADSKVTSDLNLNLGNNYFLLSNYPKANEAYLKVESASKSLQSKNQFENYRREAVFRYNFGRSLIYQGHYAKAIEQFDLSIQLYFKNEYYQSVNLQASEDSQINRERLINVRSKLALLFSLKGLSELESQRYSESIASFQTAIAYNKNINFVHPINLYNYLAIAFQKSGRFRNSYEMLGLSREEYEKSKPGLLSKVKSFSLWNLFLPADSRVIGEGRFPGEFPNDFKYLLSLGIGIENHIEQREFAKALSELENRNEFIKKNSLDKTIMGASILAKSKQIAAQIHYENKESDLAITSFHDLLDLVQNSGRNEGTGKSIAGYASSIFTFIESDPLDLDNINKVNLLQTRLEKWKSDALSGCDTLVCELQFRKSNVRYDILKGLSFYYKGELLRAQSPETAMESYAIAAELLENPGEIDPREIGLLSDPLSRKERIRLLNNLTIIYFKLGDASLAERKLKEAIELAYEFRLEEELFLLNQLKLDLILQSNSISKSEKMNQLKQVANDLEGSWKTRLELRLFTKRHYLEKFASLMSRYYLEISDLNSIPSIWEELRNVFLFRDVIGSQFEFEDSKLNLAYADLIAKVKNLKRIVSNLEEKSQKREEISAIIKSREQEITKVISILSMLKDISPSRIAFFQPFTRPTNSYQDTWIGYYKNGDARFLLMNESGKLKKSICDSDSLPTCQIKGNADRYFIQGIGAEFTKKDAEKFHKYFQSQGKEVSFIFDRNHISLFQEKNERNWKWSTLLSDEKQEKTHSAIRLQSENELGPLLYDTDILISRKIRKLNGSLFGDEISQIIPLREIFSTTGSEISITGIPLDVLGNSNDWNRVGGLYEVLRSKRIQNLLLYKSPSTESSLLSGRPDLSSLNKDENVLFFGNWDSSLSSAQKNNRVEEFLNKAFKFEKDKDYTEAYNYYYTASTLMNDSDGRLPDLELKLANLKVELFPNVSKLNFFEPLVNKYSNQEHQNKIRYQFFVNCYSEKQVNDCEKLKETWIGSSSSLYAKGTRFYKNLRKGNVSGLSDLDKARGELEKSEDAFLQSYRLGTLYIQNYLFNEAERELGRTYKYAKTPKEKNIAKNRELEIYYHKGLLYGDKNINLTNLTSTSAYSLGFRKLWKEYDEKIYSREFTKFGYADSIYDQYRKKLYEGWKSQQNKGYFDPLILTPEFLTTGSSVLGKLSHLNRTLMFSLLRNSTDLQKSNEVNALIQLILKEEKDENRPMRYLTFLLLQAEKLYLRGDVEEADKFVREFETEYERIGFGNTFLDDYYTNLKYRVGYIYEQGNPEDYAYKSEFATLYPKIKASTPDNFIPMLNELFRSLKNEYISDKFRMEMDFIFLYMLKQSLKRNSSETFFDIAMARDQFTYLNERNLGEKIFIGDSKKFEVYSERLKKKIPKNQEFSAVLDVGKKTYLLSFTENKSVGREMFVDNKDVNREIMKYFLESEIGGLEMLLRDAVSDKYRNSIRLTKGRRHYLYMSGMHSKVPIHFPDIELYFVSSVSSFLQNNSLKRSKLITYEGPPGLSYSQPSLTEKEKVIVDLIGWEIGAKKESKTSNMDYNRIDWNQNSYVDYNGLPIAKITLPSKYGITFFGNSLLGGKTFYSNDFFSLSYYIGAATEGLYILHSGEQFGAHNIKFAKKFYEKFDTQKPIQVRLEEGREAARLEAPEDRKWTGYRLYTSALIEDI